MPQSRTFVLVVADESTSMLGVAKGVRIGVNAYLADLAADTGADYRITLVTFADEHRTLCSAVPVAAAPRLDTGNYRPNGQTALLDTIAATLTGFDTDVHLTGNDKVLFVLATDGAENWSSEHSPGDVLQMVCDREATGRWTFIHLAAGPVAAEQSLSLGLRTVIAIAQQDLAREAMYHSVSSATMAWAAGGHAETSIADMIERDLATSTGEIARPVAQH